MEQWTNVIATLGFPIACVLAMGYFIFIAFKMFMSKADKREDRLYELIADCQTANETLLATNASFIEALDKYNSDLEHIKSDVGDIKTYLSLNKREGDSV